MVRICPWHTITAIYILLQLALAVAHTEPATPRRSSIIYTEDALKDQILNLPGLTWQPTFNQFAGYLTVDVPSNRSIFYWYTESQNEPTTDPLIWWSNGGPGCSGLMGFLTEHGPFRPDNDGSGNLIPNPYAWNTIANTLYVESPAGVGYSFSNNATDYHVGDDRTASDNLIAIGVFLQRFPHLLSNEFYISSESYGGHYVPQLATLLVDDIGNFPNFKGFLLGNPLTDIFENLIQGQGGTLCGHSLASKPTCDAFVQNCQTKFSLLPCALNLVRVLLEAGALDRYGLDYPTCPTTIQSRRQLVEGRRRFHGLFGSSVLPQGKELETMNEKQIRVIKFVQAMRDALKAESPHHARMFRSGSSNENMVSSSTTPHPFLSSGRAASSTVVPPRPYDPCLESEETIYLNRADVRAALNVSPKAPGTWISCTFNQISYNWFDELRFLEPLYPPFIQAGLRMVIQSGDDDEMCATLGTQKWMYATFTPQAQGEWRPWYYESAEYGRQIAGFRVNFDGITLVTVHSAGHMIPNYKPEQGLAVFTNFLNGTFTQIQDKTDEVLEDLPTKLGTTIHDLGTPPLPVSSF